MAYDIGRPDGPLDPGLLKTLFPKLTTKADPGIDPEGYWEGRIKGATGSARLADFTIRTSLIFAGGDVYGRGHSPEFPYANNPDQRTFRITGANGGNAVRLELLFDVGFCKDVPWRLDGAIDAERRRITGEWLYRCEGCGCGGSTGWFELIRVDAPTA